MKRAQYAMEYLMVTGFAILLLLPAVYILFDYSSSAQKDISKSQINEIGSTLIGVAEDVYYYGKGSKLTVDVTMPDGIRQVLIHCSYPKNDAGDAPNQALFFARCELIFETKDDSEIVFSPRIPILSETLLPGNSGTSEFYTYTFPDSFYSAGKKKITLEAKQDVVRKIDSGAEIGCEASTISTQCYPVGANSCTNSKCTFSGLYVEMRQS